MQISNLKNCGFFLILTLIGIQSIIGQEAKKQKNIEFEDFLNTGTTSNSDYMREIYLCLKFPSILRKRNVEDRFKVVFDRSSGSENIKVVSTSEYEEFNIAVRNTFDQINEKYVIKDSIPFVVELEIDFDLEPFDEYNNSVDIIRIYEYRMPTPDICTWTTGKVK